MSDGRFTVDSGGKIQEWDRGMETLTGYPRSEVAGRSCEELQCEECIHANCPFEFPGFDAFSKSSHEPLAGCLRCRDGTIVPVVKELWPLCDSTGVVTAGEVRIRSSEGNPGID